MNVIRAKALVRTSCDILNALDFETHAQLFASKYLKQDRWEQEGKPRSKVGIVADAIRLMASKEREPGDG